MLTDSVRSLVTRPWPPQEAYYEAVEHYGFEPRPFEPAWRATVEHELRELGIPRRG